MKKGVKGRCPHCAQIGSSLDVVLCDGRPFGVSVKEKTAARRVCDRRIKWDMRWTPEG